MRLIFVNHDDFFVIWALKFNSQMCKNRIYLLCTNHLTSFSLNFSLSTRKTSHQTFLFASHSLLRNARNLMKKRLGDNYCSSVVAHFCQGGKFCLYTSGCFYGMVLELSHLWKTLMLWLQHVPALFTGKNSIIEHFQTHHSKKMK